MKRKHKIMLDALMFILALTLYDKNFFGLIYHRVAGGVLCVLIAIHIGVNLQMLGALSKNLRKVDGAWRVCFCMDCVLIALFCYLLVSGVLSSLPFEYPRRFLIFLKHSHKKVATLVLLVLGVHIGLHIKKVRFPVAVAVSAVVLVGAVWGLNSSKVLQWVAMPIASPRQKTAQSSGLKQKITGALKDAGDDLKTLPGRLSGKDKSDEKALLGHKDDDFDPHLPLLQKIWLLFAFGCLIGLPAILTYWILRLKSRVYCKQ